MSDQPARSDFGARDERVACLTYTRLRRREGIPDELFHAYWRDVHGPLCARLPGLGSYLQHHLARDHTAELWRLPEGVERITTPLDGIVEIGHLSDADQATFTEASALLFGDERNFIGHDIAWKLPRGSRTVLDRQADATPNGRDPLHRLHLHLHARTGGEPFRAWADGFADALAAHDAADKVRLHLPEPYDNADPQPPAPDVDHVLEGDGGDVALLEVAFGSARIAREVLESAPVDALIAGSAEHVRAQATYLVRDVIHYVRDGELTTAGLRGAGPAALVEALGAANQVQEDVTRLFVR